MDDEKDTRRSRSLYLDDETWDLLRVLAETNERTMAKQFAFMVKRDAKAENLDAAQVPN